MQFLFYTDYQDFLFLILYYSPELIFGLVDYFNFFFDSAIFSYNVASWSDLFNDSLNSNVTEFVEYFLLLVYYFWFIIFFVNIFRILVFNKYNDFFFIRFIYYFNSLSKELRFHFDGIMQVTFFIFFY